MADAKPNSAPQGDRLAKVMARAGLCSRRDAERWIVADRVTVNGTSIRTPAYNVTDEDVVVVDGKPIGPRFATRVWLYHKPAGLMVTEKDPEGRTTIFDALKQHGLPRVVTVGRLDYNTEGLLLLTNDGGLKRVLELPATGWLRKYRVRAHGRVSQKQLDTLKDGITHEGIKYGPISAVIEREKGGNVWIDVSLREGKNREIKNVFEALGLQVNRLIRISYGPFQLADLPTGAVSVVKARFLRDQLGSKLAKQAGVDFDGPLPEEAPVAMINPNQRVRKVEDGKMVNARRDSRRGRSKGRTGEPLAAQNRIADEKDGIVKEPKSRFAPVLTDRQGRPERPPRPPKPEREPAEMRRVHFNDGSPSQEFLPTARKPRTEGDDDRGGKPFGKPGGFRKDGPRDGPPRGGPRDARRDDRPERGDRPDRGDRPSRGPRSDKPGGFSKDGPPRGGSSRGGPPRSGGPSRGAPRKSSTRK